MKKSLLSLFRLAGLIITASFTFQEQTVQLLSEKAVESRNTRRVLASEDALTLGLCGTGLALPNPAGAGTCNVIVVGDHVFVIDAGGGRARNLDLMDRSPAAKVS
ncbi:hypothetical protein [Pontixanthobacter luteolus]|uniref:hypothetical protein n=1 Tax=Pontixanthobacter luteolus TaxID=295089 RepID=UPI002304A30B|nr:hypothetical protein [Pontixanthobacter luteolus]